MVGDGPLLQDARQLVNDLQLQGRVRFLGVEIPQEVAALMRQVRVFVQHSLMASDGSEESVSVMEAQLSALPVVSTRHAGIPDVVIDGGTGLLVEEGDVRGMAEAMERLMADSELAARFGRLVAIVC